MTKNFDNFNFLRFIAAYLVLFSHQFALMGHSQPGFDFQSLGGIGVMIFFSISGYLVAQSWERDPSLWRFLAKRILRIWPGLILVTLLTALVLGPMISTFSLKHYFLDPKTWTYFKTLKMTIRYELPGVFTENPFEKAVNGSLWTLPIEFHWYLILLALGMLKLLQRSYLILAGTIVFSILTFHDVQHTLHRNFSHEYGVIFCYGVCLHYCQAIWSKYSKWILVGFVATLVALVATGQNYAALFLILPALVIFIGKLSTPIIRQIGRLGDISYGVYIYAFPVQQTVILLSRNSLSLESALAISTTITIMLAFFSWHLVEQPALKFKRYLHVQSNNLNFLTSFQIQTKLAILKIKGFVMKRAKLASEKTIMNDGLSN